MQGAKYKVKGAICKVSAKEQVGKVQGVLHPTKEGQFPRDPIFFGQIPIF